MDISRRQRCFDGDGDSCGLFVLLSGLVSHVDVPEYQTRRIARRPTSAGATVMLMYAGYCTLRPAALRIRDGNRTELEPNRISSNNEEPELNKSPAVWVLRFKFRATYLHD